MIWCHFGKKLVTVAQYLSDLQQKVCAEAKRHISTTTKYISVGGRCSLPSCHILWLLLFFVGVDILFRKLRKVFV